MAPTSDLVTFCFNDGIERQFSEICMGDIQNDVLSQKFEEATRRNYDLAEKVIMPPSLFVKLPMNYEDFKLVCSFVARPGLPRPKAFFSYLTKYVIDYELSTLPGIRQVCHHLNVMGSYHDIQTAIGQVLNSFGSKERNVYFVFDGPAFEMYPIRRILPLSICAEIMLNVEGFSPAFPLQLPMALEIFEMILHYLGAAEDALEELHDLFQNGDAIFDDVLAAAVYLGLPKMIAEMERIKAIGKI